MWPVSNWHVVVMVKAVLFEAQGGGDGFPAGPRAFLSRFSTSEYFRAKRLFPFVLELSAETKSN